MTVRNNWKKHPLRLPTQLEAELAKLREVAPPPPPPEDPLYKYLRLVYRLRRKVASSAELQNAIKSFHAAHFPRTLQQYAAFIIQMTAGDHVRSKKRYKYVTALEYAFSNNVKSEDLTAFIKKQGGLNKCVELWNKSHGSRSQKKRQKKSR
jgi:hypothetical protein